MKLYPRRAYPLPLAVGTSATIAFTLCPFCRGVHVHPCIEGPTLSRCSHPAAPKHILLSCADNLPPKIHLEFRRRTAKMNRLPSAQLTLRSRRTPADRAAIKLTRSQVLAANNAVAVPLEKSVVEWFMQQSSRDPDDDRPVTFRLD